MTSSNTKAKQVSTRDIDVAVRVLTQESDALKALSDSVDDHFVEAVSAVHNIKGSGRLIVAGIGKSGHVARKIAATLASTGTPAYFVHPGEASHGDMGMITEHDVVLMLSNSGENSELSDLIHYTRRYNITLIAMTGNVDSTLSQYCDICLLLPQMGEVCPNGLAPTTSTTMMMAYGDAFAIALLERSGLTQEQYKVFHPGGKLGQRLMKVSELMIEGDDLPIVTDEALMDEVLLTLSEKNLGCVLVFGDGQLVGIVTDGDLKRHMAPDLLQKNVTDIMSGEPRSIEEHALVVEAIDVMTQSQGKYITSLIVRDEYGGVAGMIRLQDCLQAGVV